MWNKRNINLTFKREESGKWYVQLPLVPHPNRQMVAGADTLLSELAGDKNTIHCTVNNEFHKPDNITVELDCRDNSGYGAHYEVATRLDSVNTEKVWLCPVTKIVFGTYPKVIYVSDIVAE